MYKIDLHTHSIASADGGLDATDYQDLLRSGGLDAIAITDHDTISFAAKLHRRYGDKIIVGQEINTTEGEIIGLFLKRRIDGGLSPEATIVQIRQQHGLVYIPHPFETVRHGVQPKTLDRIALDVDIIETSNGRAYVQNKSARARTWAKVHQVASAASSDAHGRSGWGRTYTIVGELPDRHNLVTGLADGQQVSRRVGPRGVLYPKLNRLKKKLARDA